MMQILVRWIGRRCLRWFYRECCFVGRERIPAHGPVLLIGNHWNDIPDALSGFLSTPRPVHYVATIAAASSPLSKATYRGLGIIPVTRVRDARKMIEQGRDPAAMNADAFRSVTDVLARGGVVGIFPEGGVHDGPSLAHFRAGVAKMALDGAVNGAIVGMNVIAFGMQYDAPRTPRSDMTVAISEAVDVDQWLAEPAQRALLTHASPIASGHTGRLALGEKPARDTGREAAKLALAMRNRLRDTLISMTRNAPTWELAESRDRLVAAVSAATCPPGESVLEVASHIQLECGRVVEQLSENADTVTELADAIAAAVEQAGGIPSSPRDTARVLSGAGVTGGAPNWPSAAVTVATAPFALLGWLLHGPVFAYVWRQAQRTAGDRTEIVARAFLPGLYLILCWYLVLAVVFAVGLYAIGQSTWLVLPAVMVLPRLGDLALSWRDAIEALRLRRRVASWHESDRASLRTSADALRVTWTSHLSGSAVKAAAHMSVEAST